MKKTALTLALVATLPLPVHAELQARYLGGSATANAYYDSNLNITWLADANLAASNSFGVSGIGDNGPGTMTWTTAQSWVAAMDAANYLGYSDWRLPTTAAVNGIAINYNYSINGSTDVGYNVGAPGTAYVGSKGSELANLFYNTLGNKAFLSPTGDSQLNYGLSNPGPFENFNFQSHVYWSGTEYAPNSNLAWGFFPGSGYQGAGPKSSTLYALAVRSGDVAVPAVPEPESYALMVLGMGLVGWRARRRG